MTKPARLGRPPGGHPGRRQVLAGAAATLAAPMLARPARAGSGPMLLVGAEAGSVSDRQARAFAVFLQRYLPEAPLRVRNMPGDAGMAAYRALAGAAPNGSVLGWGVTPSLPARAVDHGGQEGGGEVIGRLRLLGAVQEEAVAVVAPANGPVAGIAGLRDRPETLAVATPQAGGPGHLIGLLLRAAVGGDLEILTFPSGEAARQAVLGGNVAAAVLPLSGVVGPLREGKLVGLAVSAPERCRAFPDLPTLTESDLPVALTIRRGLAAPSTLSEDAALRIGSVLQSVAADDEFHAQADTGAFDAAWMDGARWTEEAAAETAALRRLWSTSPWFAVGQG